MRRLPHFLHADAIAVVAIAVLGDRNAKVEFRIAFVRLRLAQIPCGSATPDEHAGKSQGPCVFERYDADVDVTFLEYAIVRKQSFEIVTHLQERVAEGIDVLKKLSGEVLMHAADTEIIRVHARARGALIKHHQLFALLETPQIRCERTNIRRLRGDVEEMRKKTPDLAKEHADELRPLWKFETQQLFRRETKGVFLIHRRDVIQAIEIRQCLQVSLVLDQLLGAAM